MMAQGFLGGGGPTDMKHLVIVGTLCCLSCMGFCDPSLSPSDYTFLIQSPNKRYSAVQTHKNQFQVFDNETEELIWSANTNFGTSGHVQLSDSPDYVIFINGYFDSHGWSILHSAPFLPM